MSADETSTLLAKKLLAIVEAAAESDLADSRARLRWRRDVLEQLDRIEDLVARKHASPSPPSDPAFLTRSEVKSLLAKSWPYVVAGLSVATHLFRSFYHI